MSSVADDTIRIKDIVMITPDTPATKKRNVNKLNISHTVHLQRKKKSNFWGEVQFIQKRIIIVLR